MDWHRFEECADQLTVPFNAEVLRSDTAANEVIKPFNKDFQKIKIALIDYLKKEQIRIPFSKKVNVSSRLSPSTLALTFNYTNLCENKNPFASKEQSFASLEKSIRRSL